MSNTLFCPIRKSWVTALPEEKIRQRLLAHMIQNLGFPQSHLVVEKGLAQMPHLTLSNQNIPTRRADIICFSSGIHSQHALYPLLLVECKAVPLTSKVLNQVAGYNHFLQAYYISVMNENEIKTGWYDRTAGAYAFVDGLLSYDSLKAKISLVKPQSTI